MAAGTGEQILTSFLAADERLVSTATADGVVRGFTTTPPQFGDGVTVGVTDHRLIWFDDELGELDSGQIDEVDIETVAHRTAPLVVRLGSFAMLAGLVAGVVAGTLTGQPLTVSLGLAGGGIAAFALSLAVARYSGDRGGGFERHRLTVQTADDHVEIWGDPDDLASIEAALASSRSE